MLCGPISLVVNLEMSSTGSFCVWKCNIWVLRTRKLPDAKFLSIAFWVIDLINMLIRRNHLITNNLILSYPETSFLFLYQHFKL